LAKDLTLPRLRDERDTSPAATEAAQQEWSAARRGAVVTVTGGRETVRIDPALIARAAEDIGQWNTYLRSIPPTDTAQWARSAGRTAGVFAAWSARVEPTPGPLAAAARALSQSAQIPAHQRTAPQPDRLHAGGAALIVTQGAILARGGAAANALLLRQMMRTMDTFADAERAAGRAHHAQMLVQVRERELTDLHTRWRSAAGVEAVRTDRARTATAAPDYVPAPTRDTAPPTLPQGPPPGVSEDEWEAHRLAALSSGVELPPYAPTERPPQPVDAGPVTEEMRGDIELMRRLDHAQNHSVDGSRAPFAGNGSSLSAQPDVTERDRDDHER